MPPVKVDRLAVLLRWLTVRELLVCGAGEGVKPGDGFVKVREEPVAG